VTVHNHGTEDGPGLACRELNIGGQLVGACMPCNNTEKGCAHPRHHHAGGNLCRTVTVTGPPSPPDASAHLEHPGRNWGRCNCTQYQAGS
jgi:hypothetical protein